MTRTIIEPKPIRKQIDAMVDAVKALINATNELREQNKLPQANYGDELGRHVQFHTRFEISGLYEFEGDQMVALGASAALKPGQVIAVDEIGAEMNFGTETDREAAGEVKFFFEIKGSV